MSKAELLEILAKPRGDEEIDHGVAEKALLAYVGDPEITEAWAKASDVQNWWYA